MLGASSPLHFEVKETRPRLRACAHAPPRRRRRRGLMTSLACAAREPGARADARPPCWPPIAPPRSPGTRRHEGDTAFQLRAPLPPPRHRGEEGKRPRGTSGSVGARVARPPAAFRLGRADLALAGPRGDGRCVPSSPRLYLAPAGSLQGSSHSHLLSASEHLVSTFLRGCSGSHLPPGSGSE